MLECETRTFPNVHDVKLPCEINALDKRYRTVKKLAERNGSNNALFLFEFSVQKTSATINVSLIVLLSLLESEKAVYHNYYQRLVNSSLKNRGFSRTRFAKGIEIAKFDFENAHFLNN